MIDFNSCCNRSFDVIVSIGGAKIEYDTTIVDEDGCGWKVDESEAENLLNIVSHMYAFNDNEEGAHKAISEHFPNIFRDKICEIEDKLTEKEFEKICNLLDI